MTNQETRAKIRELQRLVARTETYEAIDAMKKVMRRWDVKFRFETEAIETAWWKGQVHWRINQSSLDRVQALPHDQQQALAQELIDAVESNGCSFHEKLTDANFGGMWIFWQSRHLSKLHNVSLWSMEKAEKFKQECTREREGRRIEREVRESQERQRRLGPPPAIFDNVPTEFLEIAGRTEA